MAIVEWVVKFFLKLLLQGLFNDVLARTEEEAKRQEEASKLNAQSAHDAAAAEVAIARHDAEVEVKYETAKPNAADPFNNDLWNKEDAK